MASGSSSSFKYILLLSLLSIFAIYPLLHEQLFTGHDMPDHIARCVELKYSLENGVFFPRIFSNLCFGYSVPILNFQSPLFYYAVWIVDLFTNNIAEALKLLCALCFIFSGIFMFYLVRYIWKDERASLIAGLLYIYTPYHISEIYVRASLTEFFAVTLFPLLLLQYLKFLEEKTPSRLLFLGILVAMLILSHNPMALIFPPFLAGFILYRALVAKRVKLIWDSLKPFLLGLALSLFFTAPAFIEKQYIGFSKLTAGVTDFRKHFVYLFQFFSPVWGNKYSVPGPVDGMSFQLGFFNMIAVIFAVLLFNKFKRADRSLIAFLLASFFATAFLMLENSRIIWDYLPLLPYIQFPWRFLALTGFISSILAGAIMTKVLPGNDKGLACPYLFLICIAIILPTPPFFKYVEYKRESLLPLTPERVRYSGTTSSYRDEYLPIWVKDKPTHPPASKIEPQSPSIRTENLTITPQRYEFTYYNENNRGLIRINTFYFPGWKARIDGQDSPLLYEGAFNGIMHLQVPSGKHRVKIEYAGTNVQKIGWWASVCTFFALLLWTIYVSWFKPKTIARSSISPQSPSKSIATDG